MQLRAVRKRRKMLVAHEHVTDGGGVEITKVAPLVSERGREEARKRGRNSLRRPQLIRGKRVVVVVVVVGDGDGEGDNARKRRFG